MSVLLINPANHYKKFADMAPIGLASIATYLSKNSIKAAILDYEVDKIHLSSALNRFNPDMVCIGGTTETRFESFSIARAVKHWNPETRVVYGGPHASLAVVDSLKIREIDYIVRGDGEKATFDLITKNPNKVDGVSFKRGGAVIHNPRARKDSSWNLEIDYNLLNLRKYRMLLDGLPAVPVMTSLGCPFECAFCSAGKIHQVQRRPVDEVLDELEYLNSSGYEAVKFFDATLTVNEKYLYALLKGMKQRRLDLLWECESRADAMSLKLLSKLKAAGCSTVDFSLESASQKILDYIGKGITVTQAKVALRNVKKTGLRSKMFFMYGLPNETLDDAMLTYKFIQKHRNKIDYLSANVCSIYPGTKVEKFARNNRLMPVDFDWSRYYKNLENLKDFNANPHVPKLIQPILGRNQLRMLFSETYKEPISLELLKRKIGEIGSDKGLFYSIGELFKSLRFRMSV